MINGFTSKEDVNDYPENEEDLVLAVDIEGYVYIAHCRNRDWYCAITGRTILNPIGTWIMIEPANHRSSTPELRKALAEDIKNYCL